MLRRPSVMFMSKGLPVAMAVVVTCAVVFFFARGRRADPSTFREGERIVLRRPPPPPERHEVRAKVDQVFRGVVTVATDLRPYFLAGDFNGDGLPDLAVFVKPTREGLDSVNREVANWILEDPFVYPRIKPDERVTRESPPLERVRADPGEVLLAIIHGHGRDAWRSPEARQTYLLRKAAGGGMRAEPFSESLLPREARLLMTTPKIDTIREILAGSPGFLYWNGAKYAWAALGSGGTLLTSS
jgi:FG-GAP repeat